MDSSSQLTIAYDMLYYIKFTVISIKIISRPLATYYSFADSYQQLSEGHDNKIYDLF